MRSLRSPESLVLRAILIAARHEAGLTQRQLAALAKRPPSWVAKMEIGERRIFFKDVARIERATQLPPHELIKRFFRAVEASEQP